MQEKDDEKLLKRRQESLRQLREDIGSPRQENTNTGIEALTQAREVLKNFSQAKKLEQHQSLINVNSNDQTIETDLVEDFSSETPVANTIKQLRQQIHSKQILKQKLEENPNLEIDSSFSPAIQQQLVSQLLSSDFLKNTQLWLNSTTKLDKEVTSTSLEELVECQKQAQYRLKVLKVLSQETENELGYLELQIRTSQGLSNQTKE